MLLSTWLCSWASDRRAGMRTRAIAISATAAALIGALAAPAGAALSAPAGAAPRVVCTWGGTPAASTGTVTFKPGLTFTPTTEPSKVIAEGPMECSDGFSGDVTFDAVIQPGGTCATQVFDGKMKGFPGVARASGPGASGVV